MQKLIVFLTFLFIAYAPLSAQTYTLSGGNWSNNGNWGGNPPPNPLPAGQFIIISGDATLNVNNFVVEPGGSVTINAGITLDISIPSTGAFTINGSLTIESLARLTNNNDTIINGGTMTINGSLYNDRFVRNTGTINITSSGTLLAANTNNDTLINSGSIDNSGFLSIVDGKMINESGGVVTNNPGADIDIQTGRFVNQTGSTLTNQSGGTITNENDLINEGIFNNAGEVNTGDNGGDLLTNTGYLNNTGTITILNGTLDNNGQLDNTITGVINNERFLANNDTLDNKGIIYSGNNAGDNFNNLGSIFNSNQISIDGGTFYNQSTGLVQNNSGATFTNNRYFNNSGVIENEGDINTGNSGQDSLVNSGTIVNNGAISRVNGYLLNLITGVMEGIGNIDHPGTTFTNEGQISPGGDGIGIFTITGNFVNSATGVVLIQITADDGVSDVLRILGGTAGLNGTMEVSLFSNPLDNGDDYVPVTSSGLLTGTFATINYVGMSSNWMENYDPNFLQIMYTGSSLPIQLLAFSGKQVGTTIELEWSTIQEVDNSFMVVERSKDGLLFSELGKIFGKADSGEPLVYHFTDTTPAIGTNYYRLRQVDVNGQTFYHEAIVVPFNASSELALRIGNNALIDEWKVQWFNPEPKAKLGLSDMNGRLLQQATLQGNSGVFTFDVHPFPTGMYIVHLTTTSGQRTHAKVFKP